MERAGKVLESADPAAEGDKKNGEDDDDDDDAAADGDDDDDVVCVASDCAKAMAAESDAVVLLSVEGLLVVDDGVAAEGEEAGALP